MESKLSNLIIEENTQRSTNKVRLKATQHFPIDEPKTYRIIGGYPSRMFFRNGSLECASDDAETGFPKRSGPPRPCAECEHRVDGSCSYRCTLELEHASPNKVYIISVPYSAQLNLSEYVRALLVDDLDAPDVLTKITRVEGDNGYPTYTFELDSIIIDECAFELTEDELAAIDNIKKTIAGRNIDIEEFSDLMMIMVKIPESRANKIASMYIQDGAIK